MNFDCCSYCDRGIRPRNSYTRDSWDWPHGQEDDVAEPVTERLAVLPDGLFLRRSPSGQPNVDDIIQTGTLIKPTYGEGIRKVFNIREYEYYGVSAYNIATGDPDTPAREDGMPKRYNGANIKELVYQDGAIRKLFWNNDDIVEVVGREQIDVDYQASIGTFATDGGRTVSPDSE